MKGRKFLTFALFGAGVVLFSSCAQANLDLAGIFPLGKKGVAEEGKNTPPKEIMRLPTLKEVSVEKISEILKPSETLKPF